MKILKRMADNNLTSLIKHLLTAVALTAFAWFWFDGTLTVGLDMSRVSQMQSVSPFSDFGANQHRILTPLIAHAIGLRGDLFPLITIPLCIIFISLTLWYFRNIWMSLLLICSSAVYMSIHWAGLVDLTTFSLLMACLILIKSRWWYVLYALSLLNHPLGFFVGVPLTFLHIRESGNGIIPSLALLCASVLPLEAWRLYTESIGVSAWNDWRIYTGWEWVKWTVRHGLPWFLLGTFSAFKLAWYYPFQCVAEGRDRWMILLFILCALSTLIVDCDITRMAGLSFLGVAISMKEYASAHQEHSFKKIAIYNLFIPTVVVAIGPAVIHPKLYVWIAQLLGVSIR